MLRVCLQLIHPDMKGPRSHSSLCGWWKPATCSRPWEDKDKFTHLLYNVAGRCVPKSTVQMEVDGKRTAMRTLRKHSDEGYRRLCERTYSLWATQASVMSLPSQALFRKKCQMLHISMATKDTPCVLLGPDHLPFPSLNSGISERE